MVWGWNKEDLGLNGARSGGTPGEEARVSKGRQVTTGLWGLVKDGGMGGGRVLEP